MMNKKFRVNDLVKYDYSEIGEYIDENHTDRPLRNDEVCDLLNKQQATIEQLKRRLDYETRMHKRWKDDCLAILEEQDLNDYVKELTSKKQKEWLG